MSSYGDFNGDGYIDIISGPSSVQEPTEYYQVEIWLNNGNETFRRGTSEVVDGPIPRVASANEIFVEDFNSDGRPDAFVINPGMDPYRALADSGGFNRLLLSQPNGKLVDASSNISPNPQTFNHGEGIGDFNGDGHLDLVMNRFVGLQTMQGVALLMGDGQGHFVENDAGLPLEIRFIEETFAADRFYASAAGLASLDADSRSDLVVGKNACCSPKELRIYKSMADGSAAEQVRIPVPTGLAAEAADPDQLGVTQILPGDINGDGLTDLIVGWECNASTFVQILRNDGNYQFTDVTLAAVGSYSTTALDGPGIGLVGKTRLLDMNGDGAPDLLYLYNGTPATMLQRTVRLNDGAGHFTPLVIEGTSGPITAAQLGEFCTWCDYNAFVMPMRAGAIPSLVFKQYQSDADPGPPWQTNTVFLTVVTPVLPELSINDMSVPEGNSASTNANFSVNLSQAYAAPVSFDIYTAPGTAAPGVDYGSNAAVASTIPSGQTSANFTVAVHGDTGVENNETYTVTLANAENATVVDGQARGLIVNDDLAQLSVVDATLVEGDSGFSTLRFTVRLSSPMPGSTSFDITTSNGSASAGSDYVARTVLGKVMDAGRTSLAFEVAVNGDMLVEPDESFNVTVSNVTGAQLGDGIAVGTITNGDSAATLRAARSLAKPVRLAPAAKRAIVQP